ncbi:DUF481 domain-containing protein [Acerihabitans sp. KWT182]|uniref:DUF481 domain-containing protein n=1 Tax=Acerihabitans sp. KWT182 TaxID=3157919 RepID=A0AAU7Q792_9GAMM
MTPLTRFSPLTLLMTWLIGITLPTVSARADTVYFKNGDRISGDIKSLDRGKLVLQSTYGGLLSLDWSAISTLQSDNPVLVRRGTQGAEYLYTLRPAKPGYVLIMDDSAHDIVPLGTFSQLVKPTPRITGLAWSGNADIGVDLQKSSTRLQNTVLDFNGRLVYGMWRHDITGSYHRETEDAAVNTDNYSARYSLDRFINQGFFWQERIIYKRDWVEDLSRQFALGTGPGYQFWADELSSFSLTALFGRINYLYSDDEQDHFTAAGIRWDYDRFIFGKQLEFYARGEFSRGLSGDIASLDADTGIRYKLTDRTTLHFSYGREQVGGARESLNEQTLSTGLGVIW